MTNMSHFYEKYTNIISSDFSNFNTSNVIKMSNMFNHCEKLKEIKGINKFITNQVTGICYIFK